MAQQLGERLPYLQERSAIKPDADHDIFAFMTSEGEREQLSRSDIERILSAHPQGHDLYLSGAGLWGINLSGLKRSRRRRWRASWSHSPMRGCGSITPMYTERPWRRSTFAPPAWRDRCARYLRVIHGYARHRRCG
jgi:hypothetical protein